jgi:hypothetical protein
LLSSIWDAWSLQTVLPFRFPLQHPLCFPCAFVLSKYLCLTHLYFFLACLSKLKTFTGLSPLSHLMGILNLICQKSDSGVLSCWQSKNVLFPSSFSLHLLFCNSKFQLFYQRPEVFWPERRLRVPYK